MGKKPGVMVYFDAVRPAIERLDDAPLGKLFRSIVNYSEYGEIPSDLDDSIGLVFDLLRPKLDLDDEKYRTECEQNRYKVYRREVKKRLEQPLSFDEWQSLSGDIRGYPTATTKATPNQITITTPPTPEIEAPSLAPLITAAAAAEVGENPEASWNAKRNHALDLLEGYHG